MVAAHVAILADTDSLLKTQCTGNLFLLFQKKTSWQTKIHLQDEKLKLPFRMPPNI